MAKVRVDSGWEAPIPLKAGRYFSAAWIQYGKKSDVVIVGSLFVNDDGRWEIRRRVRDGAHDSTSMVMLREGTTEAAALARAREGAQKLADDFECATEEVVLASSSSDRCLEILDATGLFSYPARVVAHDGIH